MKPLALALALAASLGIAACGSKNAAGPLALDQRVPSAQDAPGSKPDPVERRQTVTGPDEFISRIGDRFVNPTPKDVSEFKQSGFLRAIHETRFFPTKPGGPHTRTAVHIFSLVMQFTSADGAKKALEFLHTDALKPCPRSCAFQISEFDPDVDGAEGVRRYASAANIKATGDEGPPRDEYEIEFADGPFRLPHPARRPARQGLAETSRGDREQAVQPRGGLSAEGLAARKYRAARARSGRRPRGRGR